MCNLFTDNTVLTTGNEKDGKHAAMVTEDPRMSAEFAFEQEGLESFHEL